MRGENPVSINQSETRKKNQSEEGWLLLRSRSNYIYSERIVIGILGFLTDHDGVHLWEMQQAVYREDQHDQASKDPCSFFTDLQLQYLWQGIQSSWHQKQAWSGQQLQLTCGVCDQYFNRLDSLARHRAHHERPEAKQRLPMKRPVAPEPGHMTKQRHTVSPPTNTHH